MGKFQFVTKLMY